MLSYVFWWPLWNGGGLIGGDLYPYYFPQKAYLVESLQSGTIPLWNPLVGFGYPILGESQTGALYPPNLLLYRILNVNAAYNASQLGHYLVAFAAMYALARRLGLGFAGGLLAATVFVYGWFPPRICLEWAIIGGAWFVSILWAATVYLQTRHRRYLVLLALFLGLDLLAGHYNLAFATLLTLVPWPLLVGTSAGKGKLRGEEIAAPEPAGDAAGGLKKGSAPNPAWAPIRTWGGLAAAIGCGFLIAAIQLLPTLELKELSQRQQVNDAFAPTYGHLPPAAISQLWMPWRWYAADQTMDQMLGGGWLTVPTLTNQAEAQLYVGFLPLALAVMALTIPWLRRDLGLARPWGWLLLLIGALLFATGWPTYWLSGLPGIGFFRGPGRYSMTAVLALACLAGGAVDALLRWRNWNLQTAALVVLLVEAITTGDLWAASRQYQFGQSPYIGRQVFYATLVNDPPINHLDESPLRKFFAQFHGQARVYAHGQNIPTLLGVSEIPVYLGLGPELYESEDLRVDFSRTGAGEVASAVERLRRFGVTHLLLEQRIDPAVWPVEPLGDWLDPFLNRALARQEPYFLYALQGSRGRIFLEHGADGNTIRSLASGPNRVTVEVECRSPDRLVLRDLWYPGWEVSDPSLVPSKYDDIFRAVEIPGGPGPAALRSVDWVYRPASVWWGGWLTVLGLLGAGALGVLPRVRTPPDSREPTGPAPTG